MAAALSELASSLTQDEIPVKLRCASCNKLVINAFRLPCCDQSVCENCQAALPETCPVCAHSPLTADDCKPNKALRLTVKAFLKNEERKRDKERGDIRTAKTQTPMLEAEVVKNDQVEGPSLADLNRTGEEVHVDAVDGVNDDHGSADLPPGDMSTNSALGTSQDQPVDNLLIKDANGTIVKEGSVQPEQQAESKLLHDGGNTEHYNENQNEERPKDQEQVQQQMFNTGFGFDGLNNGFTNWPNTGAFNPLMPMPTGLPATGWGYPNMMGMPAMGLDPMMMSQGFFGGFNGGMGMNGMAGMNGMNGINGMNMGMGYTNGFGTWGGVGEMGGMTGDFGANTGYYPGSGYNQQVHQGNFHQVPHQQYPNNNYHQNRPRNQVYSQRGYGRDQGRFDKQAPQVAQESDEDFRQQLPLSFSGRGSASQARPAVQVQTTRQEPEKVLQKVPDENAKEPDTTVAVSDEKPNSHVDEVEVSNVLVEDSTRNNADLERSTTQDRVDIYPETNEHSAQVSEDAEPDSKINQAVQSTNVQSVTPRDAVPDAHVEVAPIKTISPPSGPAIPLGPAADYAPRSQDFYGRGRGHLRGHVRGAFGPRGRGYANVNGGYGYASEQSNIPPPEPKGVVGAPTGPKAMREGLPNVGPRGRGGLQIAGRGGKPPPTGPAHSTLPHASPSHGQQQTRSRSRTRSKSPASSHRRHHRRHRSASAENKDNTSEHEREKEHRRTRRRKREDEELADDQDSRRVRPRTDSVESSNRQRIHRDMDKHYSSRRDRSRERHKHRDRSRSPVRDRTKDLGDARGANGNSAESSRHKSKRDSSRERVREREKDRERDRERLREKDRKWSQHDNEDEGKDRNDHRSSRSSRKAEPKSEPREFSIKDLSKRAPLDTQKKVSREEKPSVDAHTLERENRDRERQMKELQRRASMAHASTNGNQRKRSRTNADGVGMNGNDDDGRDFEHKNSKRKMRREEQKRRESKTSGKYADQESAEVRAIRIENEREAARWS